MGTELLRRMFAVDDHCQTWFGIGSITRLTTLELPVLTGQTAVVTAAGHTNEEVQPDFHNCGKLGSFPVSALLLPWVNCTVLLQVRSILATGS